MIESIQLMRLGGTGSGLPRPRRIVGCGGQPYQILLGEV